MKKLLLSLLITAALAFPFLVMLPTSQSVAAQQAGIGIPFNCVVTVSTATTLQAVGGDCAATAGLAHYVTSLSFATNAGAIAADSFNTLKYGTGGTCGTGTTIWWAGMTTAATQQTLTQVFPTPILIPVANEICWINSTAGSKFITIQGYLR